MTAREQAIDAGARALGHWSEVGVWVAIAPRVLDAVEPIIRADSRSERWQQGYTSGKSDERARLRERVDEMYAAAIKYYEASGHSHGMGQMDAFKRVLRLLDGAK